ncbi:MAG: ABC transporter ATP-binding protein [Pseudomonadota bacterium]|uniref:ABC transporter ATP-binding protein n=1 Tax=Phenylobacterium sp. TaxID=1871053 RepID=UPI00271B51A7|nr:ABC transporter ATP-binding protein [Phenylobacterium sp.]MDO9430929.1 ABC transporter ATP-binding protein [Phenylobacterium sp.]
MSTLSAHDIEVRLGGKLVVAGVAATFQSGTVTAILGPNGAGKSTLLACLAGLRKPGAGRVRLDDADVLSMPARARARRIGFIPQTPEVAWAVEARILVGLGRTPFIGSSGLSLEDAAAIDRAMDAAGVTELADRDVTTLSGGERGRVLIARALAGDPEWLLADEPLTGLDPGHQLDAGDLFRAMAHEQGRGVIVTLHDLSLAARIADRIIVMAAGKVLADGPPAQALSPEVMASAYGVRARVIEGAGGPLIEIVGRGG